MCGIAGIIGRQEESWLPRMNGLLRHRGPNDAGEYRDTARQVSLAMRRLSIVDLSHGHQPMANEDGTVWIVFNGEIYNADELRPGLIASGHRFASDHSDTEVLIHLYEERGEQMLEELNGMFAFVIYDSVRGRIFGARDRIGEKPLYYWHRDGRFAFASEMKSLLALPFIEREVDPDGVWHYMSLLYLPEEQSILRGISRLRPGHCFTLDLANSRLSTRRYWKLGFEPDETTTAEEWPERIRAGLRESVRRRLMADVPVGCSLSGGVDSAAIVGLLGEMGVPRVRTYSLGFAGEEEQRWNELPLAREVAERWGTEHHEWMVEPTRLLDDLLQMVWHLDEPYGGGLPSWFVFQSMRQDVTVGLTGSGGDELFGNYGKFTAFENASHIRAALGLRERFGAEHPVMKRAVGAVSALGSRFPGRERRARAASLPRLYREPVAECYLDRRYYFSDAAKGRSVLGFNPRESTSKVLQRIYDEAGAVGSRNALAFLDLQTQLPEEFLFMTDRFSMAQSIEARVPFLDHTLVEMVFRIPARLRTRTGNLKYLLKEAMADLIPENVLRGGKKGFVLPIELWLRGELRPLCERMLSPDRLRAQGFFQADFYERYVKPHLEGRANWTVQIWSALMFQLWHFLFIEQKATEAPTATWRDLV